MIPRFGRPWQIDLVGAALCIILTCVAYLVVVAPRVEDARVHAAQRASLLEWSSQTSLLAQMATELDSRLDRTRLDISNDPVDLEPASSLNSRLNDINNIAASQRLAVEAINVRTPVETENNITFPIEFAGSGQFGDLITFFDRVNREMSATGVVAFRVTQGASDMSFVLDLAWYAGLDADDHVVQAE